VSPMFVKVHMPPTAVVNLFFVLSYVTGQPVVGSLPESSQGATATTTESTVITTSATPPFVHTTEALGPGPGDEMVEAQQDDPM